MKQWAIDRLKEGSTWRGLVLILMSAGLQISPDMANTIITVGLSLAGIIGVASPEKK